MKVQASILLWMVTTAMLGLTAASIGAQVGTSALTGKVIDESSAVIPNAEARIVIEATGTSLTALTNGEGIYLATPAHDECAEVLQTRVRADCWGQLLRVTRQD